MDIIQKILAGAHLVDCKFSSFDSFKTKIEIFFFDNSDEIDIIKENIESQLKNNVDYVFNQKAAEKYFLLNDLKSIINNLDSFSKYFVDDSLEKNYFNFVDKFRDIGIKMDFPPIFIIDEFPEPYKMMPWSACAPDQEDFENYGITPGIYFKKSRLIPFQSPLILAHELTHVAVAQSNPYLLARGLEEGLCDIIGSAYLCLSIYGKKITSKILSFKRLNFPNDQFNEVYYDYLRQAYYLLLNYGIDGLIFLIKEGRERIKETENHLLNGNFELIDLPKGNFNSDLSQIVGHICLTYGKNLCVSPLAKFIFDNISSNESIISFFKKFNIPKDEGFEAIEELKTKVYMIVSQDGIVMYNERKYLGKINPLRYILI